ncbi:uncharacterized protein METZ01_LOCUS251275 [marine metagenome]|uniref:Uncharacterized protein n=1 Tax=marine metagenome TaxID=408172 RepID=A0A382IIC9_9ZZZZ
MGALTHGVGDATTIDQRSHISRFDRVQEELANLLQFLGKPVPGFPILGD